MSITQHTDRLTGGVHMDDRAHQNSRREDFMLFVHLWLPAVCAYTMAASLSYAYPNAVLFPAGAWSLYLGAYVVYVGDRLIEPGRVPRYMVAPLWASVAIAVAVMGYFVLKHPWRLLPVELVMAAVSVAYSILKRGPLTKTLMITGTWTVGSVLLPYDLNGTPSLDFSLLWTAPAIAFALQLTASTMMYDLKDVELDRLNGVGSLPVLLGERGALLVIAGCALGAVAVGIYGQAWALALMGFLLFLLVPFRGLLRLPHLGPILVDLAQIVPAFLPLALAFL